MKRSSVLAVGACAAGLWASAVLTVTRVAAVDASALIEYRTQIQPIIAERCLECHSQDRRKGGLSLATYADAMDGGRNGPVIRPTNSAGSTLIRRLTGAIDPQMPKDEDPLTPAQIALIAAWIDQGARETPASPPAPAPWEASLALERAAVPEVVWTAWSSPLERFVAAYLAERHVK